MNNKAHLAGLAAIAGMALAMAGAANAQEISGGATTTNKAMAASPSVSQARSTPPQVTPRTGFIRTETTTTAATMPEARSTPATWRA